jgi:DNA ligase-1
MKSDVDTALPKDLRELVDWEAGAPVPYHLVAEAFERIGATTGRLEKESILSQTFRAVILTTPADLEPVTYLAFNHVFPAYEGLELGIGDALLVKAVVEATGRTKQAVEAAYKAAGDLGLVALQSRTNQGTLGFASKPKPLTARGVLEELRAITRTTGSKSMDRKVAVIKKMMISCQGTEAKYLVRALQGKLRIGLAAQTVLVALAHAVMQCTSRLPFYPNYSMHTTTQMSSSLTSSSKATQPAGSSKKATGSSSGGGGGLEEEEVDLEAGGGGEEEEGEDEQGASAAKKKSRRSRVIDDDDDDEGDKAEHESKRTETKPEKDEEGRGSEPRMSVSEEVPEQTATTVASVHGPEGVVKGGGSPVELLELLVHDREPEEARRLKDAFLMCTEGGKRGTPAISVLTDTLLELAVVAVKRAFSECPNLGMLTSALLTRPIYELYTACRLVPGIPVAPMLAKPSKEVADVLRRLSGQWFTMEYKYDGERAQVHLLKDGTVKIFSRNSEDNSLKYPDLMGVVK